MNAARAHLATFTLAIVVVAASVASSRGARATEPAPEAQPGPMNAEGTDASDSGVDEAERARLQAEYARLKAEHGQLEARLAPLEAQAAEERQRQLTLGPWEVLGLYLGALLLAVLWAWPWKRGRRS